MPSSIFHPLFQASDDVQFHLDDQAMSARTGETVASAVLRQRPALGRSEFDARARAGFCLMGACQDCTLWSEGGQRVRACTTPVQDGVRLFTSSALARP